MEKWKQDLLNELNSIDRQEVKMRMQNLEYGDPTSPRYEIVENYLNHFPKPSSDTLKNKIWYKTPYGIIALGAAGSLLAWAILHLFGLA
ncbi:MAG: hypothetical protein ABIH23_20910 [bacterium]